MRIGYGFLQLTARWLLCLILLLSLPSFEIALAEGGEGGGKSEPLTIASSSIAEGATGVSLNPEIKLTFTKNIVNMKVIDNNRNCFSFIEANGTAVPFDLILADDQIEFEKRNDALIIPKSELKPGTSYSVKISSNLKSKSGVTTGKEIVLTFSTKEAEKPTINTEPSTTVKSQETVAPEPEKEKNAPAQASKKTSAIERKSSKNTEAEQKQTVSEETSNTPTTETGTTPSTEVASETTDKREDTSLIEESPTTNDATEETKEFTPYESTAAETVESIEKNTNSSGSYLIYMIVGIFAFVGTTALFIFRKNKAN